MTGPLDRELNPENILNRLEAVEEQLADFQRHFPGLMVHAEDFEMRSGEGVDSRVLLIDGATGDIDGEGDADVAGDGVIGGDLEVGGGLYVGATGTTPDEDDMHYDGNLKSVKAAVTYDCYAFHPLSTRLTSTSWDGDAKNGANGIIDLSVEFGAPAGIKAVDVQMIARDETVGVFFGLGSDAANVGALSNRTQIANLYIECCGVVPCDSNGDIYFLQAGELDNVYIRIYGYWI